MSDAVNQARAIQHAASTPDKSVILEAAAGSGKTKVLVDRFLRLCLGGEGVDPRAVLAITFTRRATIEIQGRLQAAARRLAALAGADLDAALTDILGRPPREHERRRAAWFHEALLEDPGGLGIDTLHAFCQKVLGRFAAEVGLDPRFAVLDERQETEYRTEALDRLEAELARDPAAASAYTSLSATVVGARGKVAGLFARRVYLQRWVDRVDPPTGAVAAALGRPLAPTAADLEADLRRALLRGTPWADVTDADPSLLAGSLAAALREFAGDGLDAVLAAEDPQGPTDKTLENVTGMRRTAGDVAAALDADPAAVTAAVAEIRNLMLTGTGDLRKPSGRAATKDERCAAFADAASPVLAVLALLRLPDLLARNAALLGFGLRALDLYAAAKRRDRVVDFQDLEYLALRLLTDPEVGPQIHYRLDARLDHLLLDEFQDTNGNQWDLLAPIVDEVLAGGDPPRTAFVVGDVKQSIYGFRGAEPGIFAGVRGLFERRAGEDSVLRLPTNFRSLPALVETVGQVFGHSPLSDHLGREAAGAAQLPARSVAPGVVTFVRPIGPDGDRDGHERAAIAVAALVRELLAPGQETWSWDAAAGQDRPRSLNPEDILILARTKTHLAAYEVALRRAGVRFLPAGRGLLARSREIQDMLALLRWFSHPADDIAGAVVLRSPCFRLPEPLVQRLLSARRAGTRRSLRETLRDHGDTDGIPAVSERLEGWFRLAGLLPLHDLLRRVCREGDLLARFEIAGGEQARFNLLRLFDLALAAEARGGSLRDFVAELDQAERLGGEEEGTLPGEEGIGRVRVMTVHGAKGLEAPVVILADAAAVLRDDTRTMLLADPSADGPWVQDVKKEDHDGPKRADGTCLPGALAGPRAGALERALAEEAHILYVALTRARDRLVVVGGDGGRRNGDSFLDWLAAADDGQPGSDDRWQDPAEFLDGRTEIDMPGDAASPAARAATATQRIRVWTPPPLSPRFSLDAPSRLDDDRAGSPVRQPDPADDPDSAASPPSRRDTEATRRGTRLHAWLERACRLGEFPGPPPDVALLPEWDEARSVWEDASLAWVFHPGGDGGRGLSEVPIIHRRRHGGTESRITGFIDRLVLREGRVDIVDYKSNRIDPAAVPALVDHYRPQLAAYREALAVIHPDCQVRCWLIWTAPTLAAARLTEVSDR